MEHFKLTPTEKEFYDKIQAKAIDSINAKAPNTPISKVKEEAYNSFLSQSWILNSQQDYLKLTRDDLIKISESYGPDLTIIPRTRYQHFRTRKSSASRQTSQPLSLWNQFVKDHINDPEYQDLSLMDRTKKIAELWKQQKQENAI